MRPSPEDEQKLEHLVHRALRELPSRRAPRSLEQRVQAEISRRAALPWWRKSFVHWPILVRASFLLFCAALARLAVSGSGWRVPGVVSSEFKTTFAQQFSWMESGLAVLHAISGFIDIMSRNIPSLWLYVGLAFFAMVYATLFGLGAVAYKALRLER